MSYVYGFEPADVPSECVVVGETNPEYTKVNVPNAIFCIPYTRDEDIPYLHDESEDTDHMDDIQTYMESQ